MKNVSTAAEGEEKTYMKPNIHIRMYLNHFASEHIAIPIQQSTEQFNWKKALYLSVKVFSTKVLIWDTIFTSPTGNGTAILRGHPSDVKV